MLPYSLPSIVVVPVYSLAGTRPFPPLSILLVLRKGGPVWFFLGGRINRCCVFFFVYLFVCFFLL